jgi:predicted dithiol-disulfide oxidoreductase (DUF899 family)
MELFVLASRKKYRFETPRGPVAVEDLWDMPLSSRDGFNLDALALCLDSEVTSGEKSYVKRRVDSVAQDKLDLVKYVIETRLKEADEADVRRKNREMRDKLAAALEAKQEAALAQMSEEEIQKRLQELST